MNVVRSIAFLAALGFILMANLNAPLAATISPDGSTLLAGSSGNLVTSAGTWTFSTKTAAGGNLILLNGNQAGNGAGKELMVANGGQLYANNLQGNWYVWTGSGWLTSSSPLLPINGQCGSSNNGTFASVPTTNLCSAGTASAVTGSGPWQWSCAGVNNGTTQSCSASKAASVSPDGSTLQAGSSGNLVTSAGTWTFSTATASGGNLILLNGKQAGNGAGTELVVANGGQLYAYNAQGKWYVWTGSGWSAASSPVASGNGQCGSANGVAVSSAPTANLCTTGTMTNFATTTTPAGWKWSCAGTGTGSTTASCSAPLASSNCPFASNAAAAGLADGCSGAPAGAPLYPNMLSSYGSKRPSWDVAGVDYYVGGPQNTASLKDPTTAALPSGCSYKSNQVSCSGSNIQLSGYDFSLHGGVNLEISGTGSTVTGNNFALAPNCSDPILSFDISANGSLAVTNNTFNGGGATCTKLVFGTIINGSYGNASTLTLEYNYFYETPQDLLDSAGPSSGAAKIIEEYNLYYIQGFTGHPDGIQLNGGNFNGITVAFNTYYNPVGANTDNGTQPFHIEAQLTSAITNSTVAYNTMLTPGTCNGGTDWTPAHCSINFDIACKQDGAGNSNTNFAAYGNYIDWSGAIAALTNGYGCPSTTWGSPAANVDLSTGLPLSTNP